jgi:integrase
MSKKRAQGEGSVYKRKDGLWVAQVTIQGKHVSKYFKMQSEARIWLQSTRTQIQDGLTLAGAQTFLKDFLEHWLKSYASSVRPNTIRSYAGVIQYHILPALGNIKLKDLSIDRIQMFYNNETENGTSPRMVQYIHSVLRRSLNFALRWGLLVRNPALGAIRPKLLKTEMKTLNGDQVRVFLSAAKGTRNEALFWIAVSTGLREGEILGLKWSDLDWKTKRLQVKRQLQRLKSEGLVLTEPKSAAGKRLIILSSATLTVLQKHLNLQQEEKMFAGENWQENDLIFPSTLGTPLDPSNMSKDFKDTLKMARLPNIRFHDLRHTAASLMLLQGIHPKIVQERLGHSDISLTLNTYSHVIPTMQEEAAEKMDEILVPIEVSATLNKIKEPSPSYSEAVQPH